MPSTSSDDDIPEACVLSEQFDVDEEEEGTGGVEPPGIGSQPFDPRAAFAEGFAEGRPAVAGVPYSATASREVVMAAAHRDDEAGMEDLLNSVDAAIAEGGGDLSLDDVKDVVAMARYMWNSWGRVYG